MGVSGRRILGCLIGTLTIALSGCSGPEAEGRADAERDLATGVLCLKTYGLPASWAVDYDRLMERRMGVRIQPVAGCLVDSKLRRYVAGYNGVMEQEIAKRFGPGARDAIVAEAQKESRNVSASEY